jgi:sulfur carrier protein
MARMVSSSCNTHTLQRRKSVAGLRRGAAGGPARDNAHMQIQLNGQPRRLDTGSTLSTLLMSEGLAERRVAVEVNGEIVPRGAHATHPLHEGDRVEIVHALGGG